MADFNMGALTPDNFDNIKREQAPADGAEHIQLVVMSGILPEGAGPEELGENLLQKLGEGSMENITLLIRGKFLPAWSKEDRARLCEILMKTGAKSVQDVDISARFTAEKVRGILISDTPVRK